MLGKLKPTAFKSYCAISMVLLDDFRCSHAWMLQYVMIGRTVS